MDAWDRDTPEPAEKTIRHARRINLLSNIALVVALAVAGAIAWTARPWEQPRRASEPLGLVGGASDAPRPGDHAPDFTLAREDGSLLRLSELRGRPVLLNFWATWCVYCTQEMPDMQVIVEQYGEEIVVLGVNAGESVASGAAYARRLGVRYELVYDVDRLVVEGYRVRAMPTSYFIDADGRIVDAHFGFLSYPDMLAKVEALLGQSSRRQP